GDLDSTSLEDDVEGLTVRHVDPLFFPIVNGSHTIQQPNDKNAQLDGGATYFYNYYGIEVTSDVYGFPIDKDERSGIFVQINNLGDQTKWNHNAINVGWHVEPGLYSDSKTHFYVHWTSDGYEATGCYNLMCPGYKIDDNSHILPGGDEIRDWLVYIEINSEPCLIGQFPKSLFTSLGDKADNIRLGGFVVTRTTKMALMGSGFLPNNTKAASLSNIQLINKDGKASKNIYSVSPISVEGKFTCGGPLE
uniref:Neprosin PEP catalytic domain-containing protein n=1 Tax=Setaria italica TaxID=4555 RepID=K3ZD66_SETIT